MKNRKGQFMTLSAVLIGLTIISTSVMIQDMQTRPITTVDEGYTLQSVSHEIEQTSNHVEKIRLLERSMQYRQGYRTNFTYWNGSTPDYANMSFYGASASLTGSKPVKGVNSRFTYGDSIPEPGDPVTFENISEISPGQSSGPAEWYVDGTNEDSGNTFSHTFSDAGFYNVSLRIDSSGGATDLESRRVQIGTLTASIESTNSPVRYGSDTLEVVAEVVNDGGDNRSETLEFEVYDTDTSSTVSSDSVDFNLAPRFSEEFTFSWDPQGNPPDDSGTSPGNGRYNVIIRIPDVEKSENVRVLP